MPAGSLAYFGVVCVVSRDGGVGGVGGAAVCGRGHDVNDLRWEVGCVEQGQVRAVGVVVAGVEIWLSLEVSRGKEATEKIVEAVTDPIVPVRGAYVVLAGEC